MFPYSNLHSLVQNSVFNFISKFILKDDKGEFVSSNFKDNDTFLHVEYFEI